MMMITIIYYDDDDDDDVFQVKMLGHNTGRISGEIET